MRENGLEVLLELIVAEEYLSVELMMKETWR